MGVEPVARRRRGEHLVMCELAKPGHKRAARMLGFAFALGNFEGWAGAALVLRAHLAATERAALAWAALRSLEDEDAKAVARHYFAGAGMPPPTLFDANDEAELWAAAATPRELPAYAAAAFRAMRRTDRRAFLGWARQAR